MLIKIDDTYLDFNEPIEVEKQARLFQDVSGVFGDYSYSFSIPITAKNLATLDLKSINERLTFTRKKECKLYSDAGEELYGGYLQIDSINNETIECSFFSGNNSWFDVTRKKLREYNFRRLEKDFNETNLIASWSLSNGIVWPLVDRGTLYQRDTASLYDNDFQPFVYVKDVISVILAQSGGIKIAGDILKEPIYNSMITTNGGLSAIQPIIDEQTAYIGKSSTQTVNSTTYALLTFTDIADPYEASDNFVASVYTLPEDWIVGSVEINLKINVVSALLAWVDIRLNAVSIFEKSYYRPSSVSENITINNGSSGDTISVYVKKTGLGASYDILSGSYIKIQPIKLRRVYPQQLLPDIDANEFISNIFTQLNIFSSYNYKTKTINTKLLENIKKTTPIDISDHISKVTNNDFTELVGDYTKASRFLYGEAGDDFTEQYNAQNPDLFYGGGFIVIDNDFLEDKSDFVELDFFAPFQVQISWMGFRLPLLEMNEFTIGLTKDFVNVINSPTDSAIARLRFTRDGVTNPFAVGDLVKITDKGVGGYSGIFRITAVGSQNLYHYIEVGEAYNVTSKGTIELLSISDTLNEDQITICNVPATPLSDFTNLESINYDGSDYTEIALGYFWLPQVKLPINRIKQSLTFGAINDPDFYQRTLLETYYAVTNQVLNDPVMITAEAFLPENTFRQLDFLTPVRIKMKEFNALFFVNRITGYNGSNLPCELELIKISNSELTTANTGIIPEVAPPPSDPPAAPIYLYAATLYGCNGCALFLSSAAITSTIVLTVGKFYQVVHTTGGTSYMAEITGTSVAGKVPVYELEYENEYEVCSNCIEA